MPARFRMIILAALLVFALSSMVRADVFDQIQGNDRLNDVFRSLSQSRFSFALPSDVESALAAQILRQAYDGERYDFHRALAVVPEGERDPVTHTDLVVTDRQANDRVVALAEVYLPQTGPQTAHAAAEARNRVQAMRTMLLLHGEGPLLFKDPQNKWQVKGRIAPSDEAPALLAFGPRGAAALGFDRVLPIDRNERDLLFKGLLFRDHPADASHVAASPLLTGYLQVLLEADVEYKAIGQVLEVLVHEHLRRTRYPRDAYWVGGGLEYRPGEEAQTMGELDILALRLADRKMVFIGECKLSSPAMFAERLKKARSQIKRIRETLEGPISDSLIFTFLPAPEKPFSIDMFRGVDIAYEVYGNSQATEFGFDHEIELDRQDGDVLFREAKYMQRKDQGFLELLSFSACRRLLQSREAAARAQHAEDLAVGMVYGGLEASLEASSPEGCRLLGEAEAFGPALTSLLRAGLAWNEISELFRGHPEGQRLLKSCEGPHVAAMLLTEDAPPHFLALILAAHPDMAGSSN